MKVSLRKSNAIQLTINEEINSTPLTSTTAIGRFDNPEVVFAAAVSKLNDTYIKRLDLTNALFSIRKLCAKANQESGVSDMLTDLASIAATVKFIKPLSTVSDYAPGSTVLNAQHRDLTEEKAPERYGSRRENITVGLVDKESADAFKTQIVSLRKTQQVISDKILELNIKTEIELNAATVDVLKKYGII